MGQPNALHGELAERFKVLGERKSDGPFHIFRVRDSRSEGPDVRTLLVIDPKPAPEGRRPPSTQFDLDLLRDIDSPRFLAIEEAWLFGPDENGLAVLCAEAEGPTLREWAQDAPSDDWLPVLSSLLDALDALHERGFLHLRLNPELILVKDQAVTLLDRGSFTSEFAHIDLPVERAGRSSAPELSGGLSVDRRADLFSFGQIVLELLSGRSAGSNGPPAPLSARLGRMTSERRVIAEKLLPIIDMLRAENRVLRPRTAGVVRRLLEHVGPPAAAPVDGPPVLAIPHFTGHREAMESLRSTASYVIDALDQPSSDTTSRRSTRMVVRGRDTHRQKSVSSFVCVEGSVGVGKRRLAGEFASEMRRQSIEVIWLTGSTTTDVAVGPVAFVIRRVLRRPGALERAAEAPEAVRRELLRFVPDLVTKIPPPASRAENEDGFFSLEEALGEHSRMLDGLTEFLIREARAKPFVMIITEFDGLPDLTVDLVEHLARRITTSRRWLERFGGVEAEISGDDAVVPLFILATSNSPLVAAETQPVGEADSWDQHIHLEPPSEDEIRGFLADALGASEVPAELTELVRDATRGDPGPAFTLLRRLLALGCFQLEGGRLSLDLAPLGGARPSDRDWALNSLQEGLSDAELTVLHLLALFPRPVSSRFLLDSTPGDRGAATEALRSLHDRGLIQRREDTRLVLAITALGPRLAESINEEDRRELHRRMAETLAEQYDREGGEGRLVELTSLVTRYGDHDLMVRFAPELAACFERVRADKRALDLYRALLDDDGLDERETRLEMRVRLAACCFRMGESDEAIAQFETILADSEGFWPAAPRASIHRRLGSLYLSLERDHEALKCFDAAEDLLSSKEAEGEDPADVARELGALMCVRIEMLLGENRDPDEIAPLCEQGLKLLREKAPTGRGRELSLVRARLLSLQAQLAFLRENTEAAEQLTRGALALQERYGAVLDAARSYYRLGNIELTRDRQGAAEKLWRKSLSIREQFGDRSGVAHILSNLSLSAARSGRLEKARELILQSLRIREESGDLHGRAASLHNLGYIYTASGELQEAVATYNECLAIREEINDPWYAAWAQTNLGHALFVLGETGEARDRFMRALHVREELGDQLGAAASLARLAELDFYRGKFSRAVERAEKARQIRRELGGPEDMIDTLKVDALIDHGLGRHVAAAQEAWQACELARTNRLELQLAHSLLVRGRILSRLGEYDLAKKELQDAQRRFEAIGDRRAIVATAMELATVYLGVGLHSDANHLLSPTLLRDPAGADLLEPDARLGHGVEAIRALHLQTLLELINREGDASRARELAMRSVEYAANARLYVLHWRSLRLTAAAAEALGDTDEAIQLSAEAQEIVEELASRVPENRRAEYLEKPAVASAIRGDSALQSLRKRYSRSAADSSRRKALSEAPKLTGVTISKPRVPVPSRVPTPRRDRPRTVHVKRLRRRSRPTTDSFKAPVELTDSPAENAMRQAELATLIRLNRKLIELGPGTRLFNNLLSAGVKLCRAERGFIGMLDRSDQLELVATTNMDPDELRQPRNLFTLSIAEEQARAGELLVSADAARDARLRRRSPTFGLGMRSLLVVPIRGRTRAGVLYLDHRFQRAVFHRHNQRLAEAVADQISLAFELREPEDEPSSSSPGFSGPMIPEEQQVYTLEPFVGPSAFLEDLYRRAPALAESSEPLLIEGEEGSGKETLARTLHELSPRKREPFVLLDCRTIADDIAEVELYGQVADAYEGAPERLGLLRSARGGTLVLDGLWDSSPVVQSRLLPVLRTGQVRPVGSDTEDELDIRLITLAPPLTSLAARAQVREDLTRLLQGHRVHVVPLRERTEDLSFAVEAILTALASDHGSQPRTVEPDAVEELASRPLKGNYRELESLLVQAMRKGEGSTSIRREDLPPAEPADALETADDTLPLKLPLNLDEAVRSCQKAVIERALNLAATPAEAAELVGVTEDRLAELMAELDLGAS